MANTLNDDRLQWVPSKYANNMIAYQPSPDEDAYYVFRKTKTMTLHDGTKSESYRCRGCERSKGAGFVSTTVMRQGRFVRDPGGEHREGCTPLTKIDLETIKMRREMVRRCKEGDDPHEAYETVVAESVASLEADEEGQRLLREKLGSFTDNRPNLIRGTVQNKKGLYANLSSRERRRHSALTAAKKRKGLIKDGAQASDGLPMESSGAEGAVDQWMNSIAPSIMQNTDQQGQGAGALRVEFEQRPSCYLEKRRDRLRPPDPDHNYNYMSRYVVRSNNGTTASTSNAVASIGNSLVPNCLEARRLDSVSRQMNDVATAQQMNPNPVANHCQMPDYTQQQPEETISGASVTDVLNKVMEANRKKSRWESFGEYIGKTLESMSEENASKVAREMQEILFRASWGPS